jgi:Arc/MetJ-type ribon-helix-helix transcriptional regulator
MVVSCDKITINGDAMNIALSARAQKIIEEKIKQGKYASPQDMVEAGLETLVQQEQFGDFLPGELDRLIEEGEADIAKGGMHDGEKVFRELREKSLARRSGKTP